MPRAVVAVLAAKAVRTYCYGFLGVLLPIHLTGLGLSATGLGIAVTVMLAGSAGLTWAVRRPAERHGARPALLGLTALSAVAALLFLWSRSPAVAVLAAVLGNVAVGTGETGPFLTVEQVVISRAVGGARRTGILSLYNFAGYGAGALGAASMGLAPSPALLFVTFLAGAGLQALAYLGLPPLRVDTPRAPGQLPSAPLIRRLSALFALDAFAGGFVLQSFVAYYLHARFGLELQALGLVFFVAQLLTATSLLLAAHWTRRWGLLVTMVVSHLVSNVFLVAIAVAPTAVIAVALLWTRHLLSQVDVPTRQAYLMAIVEDREREGAAAATNMARTVAQAVTPAVTGWVMQAVTLAAPFALGGGLKIAYDVLLYLAFRRVPLREERD